MVSQVCYYPELYLTLTFYILEAYKENILGIPPYVYFVFNSTIRKSVLGMAIPSAAIQPSTSMKMSDVITP